MRRVERVQCGGRRRPVGHARIRVERPAIETTRAPAHPVQGVVVSVPDDRADVVGKTEHLGRRHRAGIDAIDDRFAVGTILCDRHPDVLAVVVDATRMVDRPLAEFEIGDELSRSVDLEQMPDARAGIAIVASHRLRQHARARRDLDRGDEERIADPNHALRMVGSKRDRDGCHRFPRRRARQLRHPIGDDGAIGVGRRGPKHARDSNQDETAGGHGVRCTYRFSVTPMYALTTAYT